MGVIYRNMSHRCDHLSICVCAWKAFVIRKGNGRAGWGVKGSESQYVLWKVANGVNMMNMVPAGSPPP